MSELLEKILNRENMNKAYKRVKANKGTSGIDEITIEDAYVYIKENWESIRAEITERKYKPQPVKRVEIPKPNGGTRNPVSDTHLDVYKRQQEKQGKVSQWLRQKFVIFQRKQQKLVS